MPKPTVSARVAKRDRPDGQHPTILWIDPGETTGWALFTVHKDALEDPDVPILSNIQHWAHGQIDCGAKRGNAGTSSTADMVGVGNSKKAKAGRDIGLGISTSGECAGVAEIIDMIEQWPGAAIGIEDFILRKFDQDRHLLSPVRITAAIDYALYLLRRDSFRQQPSEAKGLATDARLKQWGFYEASGGPHSRDSDRHAITFLRRCKDPRKGPDLRHNAWPHLFSAPVLKARPSSSTDDGGDDNDSSEESAA